MKRSSSAPNVPELLAKSELKPVVQTNLGLINKRGLSSSNISLPGDIARPELSPRRQVRIIVHAYLFTSVLVLN